MKRFLLFILLVSCWACTSTKTDTEATDVAPMDQLAERYVKTLLKLGQYDSDIVDAYYGPEEWKPTGEAADSLPAAEFLAEFKAIQELLQAQDTTTLAEDEQRRLAMFKKQVLAAITKVEMMQGKKYSFDEEAKLLYDAEPPHHELAHFEAILNEIDKQLPGQGSIAERWDAYRAKFEIPKTKLDTVFKAAIAEARNRTKAHYNLPEQENFKLEFVTDKAWSGYNYFKGNGYSLIQINTDFPIYIERAIDLASHEGYPGHHVFNALLEQNLVNKKGWKEYSIYPLFSPQSLIAEGSANYGIDVAFPANDRIKFEKEVLFPLAGLNPAEADRYYTILEKIGQLDFAGNEAARLYLNGEISREEAADMLVKYNLYKKDKALQRTRFMDKYRSYVINYNLGQQLVREYVEAKGGTDNNPEKRWEIFKDILSNPYSASILK
ncbi:DUF885 domain-containing protein [Pontibacter cellulosilyticus]|uniref:DUF885 domain-containing protein n=1 Tax=Pontibacter cellulosilyticus TaxID=1720253 RepID=A0A923NA73_9BACT|nr:hypothetical protein [Pontibacter cellulosilyticus]MBC5995043.1 hypothetical protein [Pontibacter cellulosilyticus]